MINKQIWLVIIITIFAFALRAYHINTNPPSLSWDEVSIGYNAYTILKTGRDEHGRFLPLDTFVAYGDYKPPIAIYATVPFVAIFGLNETAVRLPSVIFGTASVCLTYFLIGLLLTLFKKKNQTPLADIIMKNSPWLCALILALSPWHINLSRAGWEANIALFFIILGVYLILQAVRNPKWWLVSFLPFIITIYTFNSSRYFTPIFVLFLLVINRKQVLFHRKKVVLGLMLSFVLLLPIMPHLMSPESRLRFNEVNIFTDPKIVETANRRIAYQGNTIFSKIIQNRRLYYILSYLRHYFDHFNTGFLFIEGDGNPKFSIRTIGQMYWMDAIFLPLGLYWFISLFPIPSFISIVWLLLSIVPAAVARETPHALRILNSLPIWQLWVTIGILGTVWFIWDHVHFLINLKIRKFITIFFIIIIVFLYVIQISIYLHNYYTYYPIEYSGEWQYGYREAIWYVQKNISKYDRIVISETIGRPYMYTLFYLKFDPEEFRRIKNSSFDNAGFYHVYGFDKYSFHEDISPTDPKKTLYVLPPNEVPDGVKILTKIKLLNGNPVLVIFEKS
jgi:4-amino-4-deoxy-L-arabinose transferase-like glycosyltransferase